MLSILFAFISTVILNLMRYMWYIIQRKWEKNWKKFWTIYSVAVISKRKVLIVWRYKCGRKNVISLHDSLIPPKIRFFPFDVIQRERHYYLSPEDVGVYEPFYSIEWPLMHLSHLRMEWFRVFVFRLYGIIILNFDVLVLCVFENVMFTRPSIYNILTYLNTDTLS